jgi:hypothetical protein
MCREAQVGGSRNGKVEKSGAPRRNVLNGSTQLHRAADFSALEWYIAASKQIICFSEASTSVIESF